MFCDQCEQTAGGTGCTTRGVCGKTAEVAALQDLLLHQTRGIATLAVAGLDVGVVEEAVDEYVTGALFSTVTNVDFDPEHIAGVIRAGDAIRNALIERIEDEGGLVPVDDPAVDLVPAADLDGLVAQGQALGHVTDRSRDPEIQALQRTVVYGLKGAAAYADHAHRLGFDVPRIHAAIQKHLSEIPDADLDAGDWADRVLAVGEVNLRAMEALDVAHTGTFGDPEPTIVPLGHRPNRAILVSGHDLKDLKDLLEQTQGLGIDIYTHGEMLPAHGYPELKQHGHLRGHYGTAWQNQRTEFDAFPGAILMTTNCIQQPRDTYAANIFTTGRVAHPDARHVANGEFRPVIDRALEMPGFSDELDRGSVTVGFGHEAGLAVVPEIADAVQRGHIRHIFVVGGCDGAKPGRSYYTDFVDRAPADTLIITLACGKFRFFDRQLGRIGDIPRLIDVGQCNDAYSAVKIVRALAEELSLRVDRLPLSFVLSWYEQKAVAVLLTLLHLGIRDIRLGPTLPAFITPHVLQALHDTFGLRQIGESAQADLDAILGRTA